MDLDRNYQITKRYILSRDNLVKKLALYGYSPIRMAAGEPLSDSIHLFLKKLSKTDPEATAILSARFQELLPLRWTCIRGWYPALEAFLRQKQYDESDDPDGEIRLGLEKALEQAIDRVKGINKRYIYSWLQSRWDSLMGRKFKVPPEVRRLDPDLPKWSKHYKNEIPLTTVIDGKEVMLHEPVETNTPEHLCITATSTGLATYIQGAFNDLKYVGDYKTIRIIEGILEHIRLHNKVPPLSKDPGIRDAINTFRVALRGSGAEAHVLATFD